MNEAELAKGLNDLFSKLRDLELENDLLKSKVQKMEDTLIALPYEERVKREVLSFNDTLAPQIKDVLMLIREDPELTDLLLRSSLIEGIKLIRSSIPVELNVAKYSFTAFRKLL